MITEDYVSFEVAKLLKEKGFDSDDCFAFYNGKGEIKFLQTFSDIADYDEKTSIVCPTLQMAMKWLREVHNINIDTCSIWDISHWLYQVFVITPRTAHNSYVDKILYTSYEQAINAAIKYCLENLI